MMRTERLTAWRCDAGHLHLHADDVCGACGAPLRVTSISPQATLLVTTTVRVSPSGAPYRLGLAVTVCGRARTLCRIEGRVRETGYDAVVLERRGATIVARPVRLR